MKTYQDLAILLLRLATAANFLSPVADRFGWWGASGEQGLAWGSYENFLAYTAQVNSFAPQSFIPFLGGMATGLEILFALMLLIGFKTRWAALGSAALSFMFAITMTYPFGIKHR